MNIDIQKILRGIRKNIIRDALILVLITLGLVAFTFIRIQLFETPIYQTSATIVMSPISEFSEERNLITVTSNIDNEAVKLTFVEILESRKIRSEAVRQIGLEGVPGYSTRAIVLPGSNVVQLTVNGPNPGKAAELADTVGEISISYIEELYPIFKFETLDASPIPRSPSSPQTVRDLTLAAILGFIIGSAVLFFIYLLADDTLGVFPRGGSSSSRPLELNKVAASSAHLNSEAVWQEVTTFSKSVDSKQENLSLDQAIRKLVESAAELAGFSFQLLIPAEIGGVSSDIHDNVYQITEETLNHMVNHSKAEKVTLLLENENENLRLLIQDNGSGINLNEPTKVGQNKIVEKIQAIARLIKGDLKFESSQKNGTTLRLSVPLN